jgi:hypothetical protein
MNNTIRGAIARLAKLRLPELQARYAEVVGETTRCPNKRWLIRKISEAIAQAAEAATTASTPTPKGGAAESDSDRVPVRELSVAELQARHLEVIGRPTGSSHVGYLRWRLRQAERGRIRVGPARRSHREGDATDFKVLPFRVDATVVTSLDQARERLGLGSRVELLRRALHDYLYEAGEREVAEFFLPAGSA